MTVDQSCECQSWTCNLQVAIPFKEAWAIKRSGAIIIVDGCERGPEPTDTPLERRNGYSLYRESKDEI